MKGKVFGYYLKVDNGKLVVDGGRLDGNEPNTDVYGTMSAEERLAMVFVRVVDMFVYGG